MSTKRKGSGSNYHPARISGKSKFHMQLEANKILKDKNIKTPLNKIDLSKPDWTITNH